jgi:hypothetical protein
MHEPRKRCLASHFWHLSDASGMPGYPVLELESRPRRPINPKWPVAKQPIRRVYFAFGGIADMTGLAARSTRSRMTPKRTCLDSFGNAQSAASITVPQAGAAYFP